MRDALAQTNLAETLALRRGRRRATAVDVLDLVMRGRIDQRIVFGDVSRVSDLGLMAVEVFDRGMPSGDWAARIGPQAVRGRAPCCSESGHRESGRPSCRGTARSSSRAPAPMRNLGGGGDVCGHRPTPTLGVRCQALSSWA